MKRYSIRWRLPLSYAGIAFLTALALGAVLNLVLSDYYAGQEREYLLHNAKSIIPAAEHLMSDDTVPEGLVIRLEMAAFFSRTRIQILDVEGAVLIDSGLPDDSTISIVYEGRSRPRWIPLSGGWSFNPEEQILRAERAWEITAPANMAEVMAASQGFQLVAGEWVDVTGSGPSVTMNRLPKDTQFEVSEGDDWLSVTDSLYGFSMGGNGDVPVSDKRSDEHVSIDFYDASGVLLGSVRVSDGPAIGSEILASVTRGWLVAGGIAVLLAAFVGWLASRTVTSALLELNATTAQMTSGDLSARTVVNRRDEIGALATGFNTMAGRIEDTVTMLRRFVADAAHELHTPLTALRTDMELVGEAHEEIDLQRALRQIGRLQSLTDDLLDLSRIESTTQPPVREAVNFGDIVHQLSAVYASQAEQAEVDFQLDVAETLPEILGNREQLTGMIGNVLDNAVKFTPAEGTVTVTVREADAQVIFSVQDTGIGIPENDLPQLFSRFHRGRNAARYPGSGLGLAIVQAIVAAHKGTVTIKNTTPGTTVTVCLPVG
jgi:signal transduction histidine kinase